MQLEFSPFDVKIISDGEEFYSESALFYAIKKAMNAEGLDVIKKNPAKDEHMLSAPYYLRDRKWKFAYTDPLAATYDLAKSFREDGHIRLQFHKWN